MVYERDLYSRLHVPSNATQEDIKRSYHNLSKTHHPDKTGRETREFTDIGEAYNILKNPVTRQIYDSHGMDGLKESVSDDEDKLDCGSDKRKSINVAKLICPAAIITFFIVGGLLVTVLKTFRKDISPIPGNCASNFSQPTIIRTIVAQKIRFLPFLEDSKSCHRSLAYKNRLAEKLYEFYEVVEKIDNNINNLPEQLENVKEELQGINKKYLKLLKTSGSYKDFKVLIKNADDLSRKLDESIKLNTKLANQNTPEGVVVAYCKNRLKEIAAL